MTMMVMIHCADASEGFVAEHLSKWCASYGWRAEFGHVAFNDGCPVCGEPMTYSLELEAFVCEAHSESDPIEQAFGS